MAYVALADLQGKIPQAFLTQALDDDADGTADAGIFDLIASQAGMEIDAELGGRYGTPFAAPLPAVVAHAAVVLAAEGIYARRVPPEQNPWKAMAEAARAQLRRIGAGEEALTPTLQRAQPSGVLIGEPARTYSQTGRMGV